MDGYTSFSGSSCGIPDRFCNVGMGIIHAPETGTYFIRNSLLKKSGRDPADIPDRAITGVERYLRGKFV